MEAKRQKERSRQRSTKWAKYNQGTRLDHLAKAKVDTVGGAGLIVLRTLWPLAIAAIEIVEEGMVCVAITSDVRRLGTLQDEILGVLNGLDGLVDVFRRADARTIALGMAAGPPHPGLATRLHVEDPSGWGAAGELVRCWGCGGGDGRGRGEGGSEDGELHRESGGFVLRIISEECGRRGLNREG